MQMMMSWLKIDKEVARQPPIKASQRLSMTMADSPKRDSASPSTKRNGWARLDREVSLSEVADLSILRQAQKELGISER